MDEDKLLVVPAAEEQRATVILLHGLGQSNRLWAAEVQYLAARAPFIEWILPQAIRQPVSLNNRESRPSWFDIGNLPPHRNEFDEQGVNDAIHAIERIIQKKVQEGTDPKRIILIGFSQGAAVCLMVGLTTLHELAGIASLSGWIPHRIREQIAHTEPNIPVFWGHGTDDTEIPILYARESVQFLQNSLGMSAPSLVFVEYPDTQHEVAEDELLDLTCWILSVLDEPNRQNGM